MEATGSWATAAEMVAAVGRTAAMAVAMMVEVRTAVQVVQVEAVERLGAAVAASVASSGLVA